MPDSPARQHKPIAGILFCVFSLLGFALQDSLVKWLSEDLPILQVLAIRAMVVLALLTGVGLALHGRKILRGKKPRPLMLRGVLAFFAFTTYYLALSRIPLADAASVYMTAPLFVTMLSALLLGEKVGFHRWGAVVAGFSAVIVMLAPGSSLFRLEAAIPLFSAMCYAMIPIINRRIGMSEHALTMAIYTTATYLGLILLVSAFIHLLPIQLHGNELLGELLQHWQKPSDLEFLLILFVSCLFTLALLGITQAYRVAVVSSVAPFEYSYLVWATLIGFFLFNHVPSTRTIIGGAVVVICGCYIAVRERKAIMSN